MRGLRALAFTTLGAMVACASFSSGGDGSPADAGAEAGPDDSSTDDGGTAGETGPADAALDAPPNLLSNTDFELGCAGWSTTAATLTVIADAAVAHGGARACQVCGAPDAGIFFLVGSAKVNVPVGAQFYGEAYVRAAPGQPAPVSFGIRLDSYGVDGGLVQLGPLTPSPQLDGTWQLTSGLIDLLAGSDGSVRLSLRSGDKDTCFLVDDARLVRSK